MHIVKRRGHKEKFDGKKLYASVYYACKSVELGRKACESISEKVLKKLKTQLKSKKVVDANYIFEKAGMELEKHDKHAALMYKTHRDLS